MSGSAAEGAREKELARRLSSDLARFDGPGGPTVPRGLARIRTDLDVPASLRVESAIVEAGQRDQRELASFHLEAARRHFDAQRDREAIAELQRVVYLAPYQSDAHLLLGRLYLRNGRALEAIDTLKISIWSDDTIDAHVSLAEAHLAAKDASAARAELELVLRRQADHVEAKRLLDTLP